METRVVSAIAARKQTSFSSEIPVLEWRDFLDAFEWKQGEHVTILGTTGSGKTTIMRAILPMRRYSVVFASKPKDPLIAGLRSEGYKVIREWPPHPHIERAVFWPRIERMSDAGKQRQAFYAALYDVYRSGGWTIALDEAAYLARTLNLGHVLKFFYEQARSLNVSVVTLSQRPKEIPLLAYSCATHLFLFRESDAVNIKRLSEISGANSGIVKEVVRELPRFSVLYVDTRDGSCYITRVAQRGR